MRNNVSTSHSTTDLSVHKPPSIDKIKFSTDVELGMLVKDIRPKGNLGCGKDARKYEKTDIFPIRLERS